MYFDNKEHEKAYKVLQKFEPIEVDILSNSISTNYAIPLENDFKKTNAFDLSILDAVNNKLAVKGVKAFLRPKDIDKYNQILKSENYSLLCGLYTEYLRIAKAGMTTCDPEHATEFNFQIIDLYRMAGINSRLDKIRTERIIKQLNLFSGILGYIDYSDGDWEICKLIEFKTYRDGRKYITITFPYYERLQGLYKDRKHTYLIPKNRYTNAEMRTIEIIAQYLKSYNHPGGTLKFETILNKNEFLKYKYLEFKENGRTKQINTLFKRHLDKVEDCILNNSLLPDTFNDLEIITITQGKEKNGLCAPSSKNIYNTKYKFKFKGKPTRYIKANEKYSMRINGIESTDYQEEKEI